MQGGIAIQREGGSPLWRIQGFRPDAVRLVTPHWWDGRAYMQELRNQGWDILAVMDRDGFADWGDWRRSFDQDIRRVDELYVQTGLIQALALGNEFDDGWSPGMADDPRVQPRGGV